MPSTPNDDVAATWPADETVEMTVGPDHAGWRLDWFLAERLRDYSRVRLRQVINAKEALVDGRRAKASLHIRPGQRITVRLPQQVKPYPHAEEIPLTVLYEDEHLVAINKPPGMVVHPARGHWTGTLVSALQFHFDQLSGVGGPSRPGIVHRLDRDTSGVIVVAKNDLTHTRLAEQWEARTVEKEYFAIVTGRPDRDRDYVDEPIGFHPVQREKMAIRRGDPGSRAARSFYEVQTRFDGFATVKIVPHTGRTHQIRVHLAHIGCPVLCDKQYGGRDRLTRGDLCRDADDTQVLLARQALHARRLTVTHPHSGERLTFEAPLPDDLAVTLAALEQYRPPRG